MDRGAYLGTVAGALFATPLVAEARSTGKRPRVGTRSGVSLASVAYRIGIAGMGLAAFGCVRTPRERYDGFLVGGVFFSAVVTFLICTGSLIFLSSRRRRRALAKIFVALGTASVCGALWILLVDTVLNATIPAAMNGLAILLVGVMTAVLVASSLLLKANRLRELVGLSAMVIGFHALALPIAVLIACLLRGAPWSPAASVRSALIALILRIRLAADLPTVGLSVGGLLLGVFLVFVGDRVLSRSRRSSSRGRFDLSRLPS